MAIGVKKWFMLQMWRVQQIAAILTLVLLAVSLSLQIYNYMSWRSGLFSSPYTGAVIILLALGLIIWVLSIVWDLRLRMWREQMAVLVERNPYAKEKMTAKEVFHYRLVWLPLLRMIEETDPEAKKHREQVEAWMARVMRDDPSLAKEVDELMDYVDGAALRRGGLRDGDG